MQGEPKEELFLNGQQLRKLIKANRSPKQIQALVCRPDSTDMADRDLQREGQRPACSRENFAGRMCDRPGCYVVFDVRHEHASRRFCSVACSRALRRVLERESRYRQRRRRWRQAVVGVVRGCNKLEMN